MQSLLQLDKLRCICHGVLGGVNLIQVGVPPAVIFSEEVESFAEVLETLIPSDVCLFEPLIDLGNYGKSWSILSAK